MWLRSWPNRGDRVEEHRRPRSLAKAAAAALDRLNYIFPVDVDLHQKLGDLWLDQGNVNGAIREYQAVLAAKPLDAAASHFNLAKAFRLANRNDEAKDELLLALEAAPGFRPAQRMLLELSKTERKL